MIIISIKLHSMRNIANSYYSTHIQRINIRLSDSYNRDFILFKHYSLTYHTF